MAARDEPGTTIPRAAEQKWKTTAEEQGFLLDPPTIWRSWKTVRTGSQHLGILQPDFRDYVKKYGIKLLECPDGTRRIDPVDLETLAEKVEEAEESDVEAVERPRKAPVEAPEPSPVGIERQALTVAMRLAKDAQGHVNDVLKLVVDPQRVTQDLLSRTLEWQSNYIEKLQERVDLLERKLDENRQRAEDLASEQLERDLAVKSAEKSEERKHQAWGLLKAQLPGIIAQVTMSMARTDPKVVAAVQLLQSLDPSLLQGLGELDILNDEQRALLATVLGKESSHATTTQERDGSGQQL